MDKKSDKKIKVMKVFRLVNKQWIQVPSSSRIEDSVFYFIISEIWTGLHYGRTILIFLENDSVRYSSKSNLNLSLEAVLMRKRFSKKNFKHFKDTIKKLKL